MLPLFSGQRTETPKGWIVFIGIVVVVPDSAACYAATIEALLFRLTCL